MVRALDSGSSGPGSSPSQVIVLCSLRQDTLLSQCFSSPRCIKGVPANVLGGNPAMD